jgi:hypothetical protein
VQFKLGQSPVSRKVRFISLQPAPPSARGTLLPWCPEPIYRPARCRSYRSRFESRCCVRPLLGVSRMMSRKVHYANSHKDKAEYS